MSVDPNRGRTARSGDFPYFRGLWRSVVVALLAAALLPLLLLGGVLYADATAAPGPEAAGIRWVILIVLVLGGALILTTVLLTTGNLVKRLEAKRRELSFLERQLEHAGQAAAAGALARGALEDITDSLANIHAASQWVRELFARGTTGPPPAEEVTETLAQIDAEVHRSERAVRNGLELSRPAAGAVGLEVNVHQLIDELIRLMRRQLHFRRIRVIRPAPEPGVVAGTDPDGLRHVLQSLILNAAAATAEGGVIEVRTRIDGNRLRVEVVDDGPGIPEKDFTKIFEPLYTTKADGLGLGLGISRGIASRLGGTLSVRNEPGRGAAFTVELPLN
jgi:signal transduction histidine kinase